MANGPRRAFFRKLTGAGLWAAAAGMTGGCSLIFHVDASQCSTDGDCRNRGFGDTYCSAGTCVAREASTMADSGVPDSGSEAGVDAGKPCTFATVKTDCATADQTHPERMCSPDTNTCVQLTTDECPLVIGTYDSLVPAVAVGAFATLPSNGLITSHPSYENYDFALSQFTNAGGILIGPDHVKRMPVAVICNDDPRVTTAAMNHLVNDVHVPGVIAALDSKTLGTMFSTYGFKTSANLFVLNPFGADSTLTVLDHGNQFWHMLGVPGDVATAYQALLPRVERYMRSTIPWRISLSGDAGPNPLRVATFTGNATVLADLAQSVSQVISWNGGEDSPAGNGPNYLNVAVNGSTYAGDPLAQTPTPTPLQQAVDNAVDGPGGLFQFQPHVVISFGSEEFVAAMERLDVEMRNAGVPPPIYIVGPYNTDSTSLRQWIATTPGASQRVIGVNFASTTDTSVLSVYDTGFASAYSAADLGQENYYDAMNFLLYSLVAANVNPVDGPSMGKGMVRLTSFAGAKEGMVAADIGDSFTALESGQDLFLDGTLGPPIFDLKTNARQTQGDVYCANAPVDAGTFAFDQMRLSNSPDGGAPILTTPEGGAPCFNGL